MTTPRVTTIWWPIMIFFPFYVRVIVIDTVKSIERPTPALNLSLKETWLT